MPIPSVWGWSCSWALRLVADSGEGNAVGVSSPLGVNLRANTGFHPWRRAFRSLLPLGEQVRMRECDGMRSAAGPLTLALSHEGRGE